MRLTAVLEDGEQPVHVERRGDHQFVVELDGARREVDAVHLEGNTWSLLVDGRSYELDIEPDARDPDTLRIRVRGSIYAMEILDERRQRMRAATGGFDVEGRATVRSPMPGKIVRVLVEEGATVEEGQGVVVVEAMKMENELKAPKAGVVVELLAEVGQIAEGGATLAVIE